MKREVPNDNFPRFVTLRFQIEFIDAQIVIVQFPDCDRTIPRLHSKMLQPGFGCNWVQLVSGEREVEYCNSMIVCVIKRGF